MKTRVLRYLPIFCILIVIFNPGFSQSNFYNGYYITLEQDTIPGYIAYLSDGKNSQQCLYKESLSTSSLKFGPEEIKGYAIDDKVFFESLEILHGKVKRHYFLKIILKSDLTLLKFNAEFFVMISSDSIISLSRNIVRKDGKQQTQKIKDGYTRGVLRALLIDHLHEFNDVINNSSNIKSEKVLLDIFSKWKNIEGEMVFIPENKIRSSLMLTPVLILDAGAKKFNFLSSPYSDFHFATKINFGIGINNLVFVPRISNILLFNFGAEYYTNNFYSFLSEDNINHDYILSFQQINTKIGFRIGKLSKNTFFMDINFNYAFNINTEYSWRSEVSTQGQIITTYINSENPIGGSFIGYTIAIGKGFNISRLNLTTSFYYNPLFSTNDISKSDLSYFGLSVGLSFPKQNKM